MAIPKYKCQYTVELPSETSTTSIYKPIKNAKSGVYIRTFMLVMTPVIDVPIPA
ncbi:hypothetical protein [Bacteroides sp.]|uniref:hypothetical protein n=1 Tax=Bacteroides sp. TaxID=29523 RepID=UPI0025C3826A|nr:hypothetical protein [Bacteroides sp.]